MKSFNIFLYAICFFYFGHISAQNYPDDFEGTWYLNWYEYDLGDRYYIHEFKHAIDSPVLIIDSNLNFEGDGVCNIFTGEFSYESSNGDHYLTSASFNPTNLICDFNNDFEDEYFFQFGDVEPPLLAEVYNQSNGLRSFEFQKSPGFVYHFDSKPIVLDLNENQENKLAIFPNPARNEISIVGLQNPVEDIQIVNVTGSQIKKLNTSSNNSYDVSDLPLGLYFIRITSEGTTTTRKFLKQ
ncbi:MAG: hypothetical protein CMC13_03845 [Flavobacteriaceae bacterium]|nr:hypothetical protein [Flavobacteriaceae bacterium]|tara:strand:- start:492 stop:1211 length:720 start_codon:yes stop_codon:yes gene_type:complete